MDVFMDIIVLAQTCKGENIAILTDNLLFLYFHQTSTISKGVFI